MSTSPIITEGIGPQGTVALIMTLGYGIGVVITPPGNFDALVDDLEGIPTVQLNQDLDTNFVQYVERNFVLLKQILQQRFEPKTQQTVGAAGSASALPANPSGYIQFDVNGTVYVIPFYKQQ